MTGDGCHDNAAGAAAGAKADHHAAPTHGSLSSCSRRLSSIRSPRDLNLTSSVRPVSVLSARGTRKVFAPNVAAKRHRASSSDQDHATSQQRGSREHLRVKDKKAQQGRGRGRGRGDGRRNAPQLVQLSGTVFAEGIAAANKTRPQAGCVSGGGVSGGEGGGTAAMMPVFTGNKKVDKEEEERKLAALLQDDFVDDIGAGVACDSDGADEIGCMAPVCLPLSGAVSKTTAAKRHNKMAAEVNNAQVVVKSEPGSVDSKDSAGVTGDDSLKQNCQSPPHNTDTTHDTNIHRRFKQQLSLDDQKCDVKLSRASSSQRSVSLAHSLLMHHHGNRDKLLFLQFPDAVPLMGGTEERDNMKQCASAGRSWNSSTDNLTQTSAAGDRVSLSGAVEGRIGRLCVHQSGAVRLHIGGHVMTLTAGTRLRFLQEVVSVEVNEDSKTADLSVLGQLSDERIVCSPDWPTLLASVNT